MWNRFYYSFTNRQFRARCGTTGRPLQIILLFLLCFAVFRSLWTSRPESRITEEEPFRSTSARVRKHLKANRVRRSKKQQRKERVPITKAATSDAVTCEESSGEVTCGQHTALCCAACPQGHGAAWCNGECRWNDETQTCGPRPSYVHPAYRRLVKDYYPFQPVATQDGDWVNVILVRAPFRSEKERELYFQYKDDILFLGISSFEAFPFASPNPFSKQFPDDTYVGLFPGWLHMMRNPRPSFPAEVKTLLMSQSDFNLDRPLDYKKEQEPIEKKYDFAYSGSDQDVANDCVGWSSFAKNWTFVKQALEVMCSDEFNLTGVLAATKDKEDVKACTIPEKCKGKILQTTFLTQDQFFDYAKQSKFVFLPQVYDASPRVSLQALALNVPVLMNRNILGGWKYLNEKTGEFFNDISDLKIASGRSLTDLTNTHRDSMYWIILAEATKFTGRS